MTSSLSSSVGRSPGKFRQALRWIQTLRHHRVDQLRNRAMASVRRRLEGSKRLSHWRVDAAGGLRNLPLLTEAAAWRQRQMALSLHNEPAGGLTLLNKTVNCGSPVRWTSADVLSQSHLWRFQLHYFEWLMQRLASHSVDADQVWLEIGTWIECFEARTLREAGDALHPFCISRRLPAWLCLLALAPPAPEVQRAVLQSVASQAEFLFHHLERDLGGNHLLENGRALMFAGTAVETPCSAAWLRRAAQIFRNELPDQILGHGEHFERSPGYHDEMRELVSEMALLTSEADPSLSDEFRSVASRMERFSDSIRHPDGRLPLFGDSILPPASSSPAVLSEPETEPRQAATAGEYWMYTSGGDFLVFDAGPVGADHLPAHAHSDLLTFEASVGGQRLIVDSGVFDYEASEMRTYCRSTASHNVLELDGENQCDVWSRFRMGRRGWPTSLQSGRSRDGEWAAATHNAYRHRSVPTVGRLIHCSAANWLIADWAVGAGTHTLTNRLHFHPDARLTIVQPGLLKIEHAGRIVYLSAIGPGELRLARGWYCPRLGERLENTVVEFSCTQTLPAVVGWCLTFVPPPVVITANASSTRIEIRGQLPALLQIAINAASGRIIDPIVEDCPV